MIGAFMGSVKKPAAPVVAKPSIQSGLLGQIAAVKARADAAKAAAPPQESIQYKSETAFMNPEVKAAFDSANKEAEEWARSQAAALARQDNAGLMKRQAGIGQLVTRRKA